ncbi:phospholipid scramblase 1-like [Sycon ciliatum]|uniref:phospholipid scramblase 1-like n=1 Tax=Sycon ciliatum TaxID=27933 RepID=UPI0020AD7C2C|eukprot:scpid81183/ scgid21703/ Phospholipid scramblase 1; Ca(2+)-dependent phospholipid scramblase 1; Erythrocyte phospholipid scramblase; MmTRA1b
MAEKGGAQWMPLPQADSSCPKGLEYLTQVDQLLVKQKVELLEALTGFETANKYVVANTLGQQVYFAAEKSGCCERQCCTLSRAFEIHIIDNANQTVMVFKRPRHFCTNSCMGCTSSRVTVEAPPGNVIGYVQTNTFCCKPTYTIEAPDLSPVLKITSPCCGCGCSCSPKFAVQTLTGEEIGCVQKKFSGVVKEAFTDADNFNITFPMDLDVKVKASLLASLFLIDMLHFEQSGSGAGDTGEVAAAEGLCCLLTLLCN